ncbi:ARSK Arylsulfatase, partial [Atractosteus spatula]|nr:ARSK Arylsulfatase [Atractosteus spatula]
LTFEPGNKTVLLPYISYMREQGAVFLNSYTNSPICCPSRAAMWSGRFVHLTESWNNYKCLEENYTTWMDLLQKQGYYTKKLGKLDYRSGGHTVRSLGIPTTSTVKGFLIHCGVASTGKYSEICSSNDKRCTAITSRTAASSATPDCMCADREILLALRDSQLLSSTVLLFTSDHGELAMEHRQFYKMSMYEGSSHVPLLVMGPRVRAGLQVPQPVSLVDIYPTALDLAGIPLPGGLSGHSLLPLLSRDTPPKGRPRPNWVLSEFHGSDVNASTYMLRTEQWKYIAYADGISVPPQLFGKSKP